MTPKEAVDDPEIVGKLPALGITADFIPGDKQRDLNAHDTTAWKKVAVEARIEIK